MAINLHHLRLFTAVVEHGGFTRAAAELNLSQPAISKSLQELERQLHVRLIDRVGRSATLTDAGRALYARASELFGVEQLAERELREIRGLKLGRLRVAATPTIAAYFLPPVLGRFHRRRPSVRIEVATGSAMTVAKLLLESHVDVALSEDPLAVPGIEAIPWRDDELVVIAAPDHELLLQDRVEPNNLANHSFLTLDRRSTAFKLADRALELRGVRLRRTTRIAGTEAIKQAVASGLGLAFVSRAAAEDQLALRRIAVVPVEGLVIRRPLARLKLRRRGGGISPASRELDSLLDEAPSVDGSSDATGVADDRAADAGNGPVVL